MCARDLQDRVHVARLAAEVHRQDRLGAGRDSCLDLRGVEVQGRGLAVHQHRPPPQVLDDRHRGREGHGAGDDLVARPDPHRLERQVQRCGAGVHRHGVLAADVGGEVPLELLDHRAGGEPAGAQAADHRLDLLLAEQRLGEGQESGSHRAPTCWPETST